MVVLGVGATAALELSSTLYWLLVEGRTFTTVQPKVAVAVSLGLGAVVFAIGAAAARVRAARPARAGVRSGDFAGDVFVVAVALVFAALIVTSVIGTRVGRAADPQTAGAAWDAAGAPLGIMLISVDTLRADHLGAYGYGRATSPNIDTLAREGALFSNAMAVSSWTLPTHTTMLTGLPPAAHGVVSSHGQRLAGGVRTLAERLRDQGFDTAAFVVPGYMDAEWGHLQGFRHYDDHSAAAFCKTNYSNCTTSPDVVSAVTEFFRARVRRSAREPFFVFVHLMDVHSEYMPPPPYDAMFDSGYSGGETAVQLARWLDKWEGPPAQDLEQTIALYDGEIRFTDAKLGELRSQLEELGLFDRTFLILTADHGEEFYEHGLRDHSSTLYQEVLHVPLILRYPPGVQPGSVVSTLAGHIDISTTLAAVAGIDAMPAPPEFVGRDLRTLIMPEGRAPQLDAEVSVATARFADLKGEAAAVRWAHFKLIQHLHEGGADELYDLSADPGEIRNIASNKPELAATGRALIQSWREFWNAHGTKAETMQMTAQQRERLRSLGYID